MFPAVVPVGLRMQQQQTELVVRVAPARKGGGRADVGPGPAVSLGWMQGLQANVVTRFFWPTCCVNKDVRLH